MVDISWPQIKEMIDDGLSFKWVLDTSGKYRIFVNDAGVIFQTLINKDDPENPDQVDFEVYYKDRGVAKLSQITPTQRIPKVAVFDPEGDFSSVVSHNFADTSVWPSPDDSTFILEPPSGKAMFLKKAEVQFTHDIQLSGVSELFFDIWVGNPGFDPGQPPSESNPLRLLFQRVVYKSIMDVLNIGNAHYTMEPVDGLAVPLSTVQFNYPRSIPLLSSQLAQVRVSSKDNIEIGGTFCTITFTTSLEDE